MVDIITIETPELGDRSYIVHDGKGAVVIDPQRDIDRVLAITTSRNLQITHVLETHMHNDYVTGGLTLAQMTGAEYCVSGADPVKFERRALSDGDVIESGAMSFRAVTTPGHTQTHLSYVLSSGGKPVAVFTGGSMLYGATGRTDLVSPDLTDELTHAQFRSVRRLAEELPAETEVYPTHGFGSFCAANAASATREVGNASTIKTEQLQNPALTTEDEEEFVRQLIAGLGSYPRYYAHMGYANLNGPVAADLSLPSAVDPEELMRRIKAGEWVVDLRSRQAYAKGHLRGTVGAEMGNSFATFFGWLVPWGVPITLVGDSPEEVLDAQRNLARIGIDRASGQYTGDIEALASVGPMSSYPIATFAELAKARTERDVEVIDVRHPEEFAVDHIEGARNIPFEDLPKRAHETSQDKELWVHCKSGYRASLGASLLDRAGRRVVMIDDAYETAGESGNVIEKGELASR